MQHAALFIEVYDSKEAERFLAVLSVGLLKSVADGVMSLAEAERLLFTPRTVRILSEKSASPELCQLISECCELEDVLDLVPAKFESEVVRILAGFLSYLEKTDAQDPYADHVKIS